MQEMKTSSAMRELTNTELNSVAGGADDAVVWKVCTTIKYDDGSTERSCKTITTPPATPTPKKK